MPGAQAVAFAQRRAQDPQAALLGPPDHAGDFGRADVQRRHQPGAVGGISLLTRKRTVSPIRSALPASGFFFLAALRHEEIMSGRAQIDLA